MKIVLRLFFSIVCTMPIYLMAGEYSIEVPQGLGQEIEAFSIFNFGDLQSQTLILTTINDNLLHGGGQVLGLQHSSHFEGDDLGQTFGISVEALRSYENAELSIEFFSNLYSRFSEKTQNDGSVTIFADNGKTRTENISNDGVTIRLKRNIKNQYFMVFETELSLESDTSGLALYIQEFFHYMVRDFNNAAGGGNVQYEIIEHAKDKITLAGSAGIGKELNLLTSDKSKLSAIGEIGLRHSNARDLQAIYINASLNYSYKDSRFSIYKNIDTKLYDKYGLDFSQKIIKSRDTEVSLELGIYKEKNRFTPDFVDLVDHAFDAKVRESGDFIYKYGIKAKF